MARGLHARFIQRGLLRACLFCGTSQVKLTGEHLWDDWLNQDVPNQTVENFRTLNEDTTTWRSRRIDRTVKSVCGKCNNGWMSDLSSEAKQTLEGMIRQLRQTCLLPYGAAIAVCFAFMKAAVLDSSLNNPPSLPQLARRTFFRSLVPPVGTCLWLGVFMPTPLLAAISYSSRLVLPYGNELHVFTYTVGHVIFHLTFSWHAKATFRRHPVVLRQPDKWRSASVQVWPDPGRIEWPPRAYLNYQSIRQFHDRWSQMMGM